MKWLVYGCGLLISSAALVALSMSGVFPALGGIGSGLLTVCVYFLGVYLAPRLIIHRLQQRVSKEKPEDIVTIEPNRKPVRRDVVGYQLAISWYDKKCVAELQLCRKRKTHAGVFLRAFCVCFYSCVGKFS